MFDTVIADTDFTLYHGEAETVLRELPSSFISTCVTSPPYWRLRDYGHDDQLGNEPTAEQYIERLVGIMREVRRTLHETGTLWLNLGDTYVDKELLGIPWRTALALQADGWKLRAEIIWWKRDAMPESVKDRPGRDHEHMFMLAKTERAYYDIEAERVPHKTDNRGNTALSMATRNGHSDCAEVISDFIAAHPQDFDQSQAPKKTNLMSRVLGFLRATNPHG